MMGIHGVTMKLHCNWYLEAVYLLLDLDLLFFLGLGDREVLRLLFPGGLLDLLKLLLRRGGDLDLERDLEYDLLLKGLLLGGPLLPLGDLLPLPLNPPLLRGGENALLPLYLGGVFFLVRTKVALITFPST